MRNSLSLLAVFLLAIYVASFGTGCNSTQVSSGILYQEQQNHEKAVRLFKEALWYNEEEAAAHYQLAFSYSILAKDDAYDAAIDSARYKLDSAFTHYMRALELDPEKYGVTPEQDSSPVEENILSNYSHYFNQAVNFNEVGRTEDAITYFDLAYVSDPRGEKGFNARINFVKLALNQANEEDDTERMEEVLAVLETIEIPSNEFKADVVNTRAIALTNLGREAEAAALFEELLADNPDDVALMRRVALARVERMDLDGAQELFDGILNKVINNSEYTDEDRFKYGLDAAITYRRADKYPELLRTVNRIEQYASTDDERARVYLYKARSYYEAENWEQAIISAEQLISVAADNEEGWQVYYLSLNKAGRTDEAMAARERFNELKGSR